MAATLLIAACGPRTGAAGTAPASSPEQEQQRIADFYRGKTVSIVTGFAPGGGFDTTARVLAKNMARHIPGEPNIIVENMPGAGSLTAANHLYNAAKADGLVIGLFNEAQVLNQVLGLEAVQFDARKFGWLGNVIKSTTTCTIRADTPYNRPEDLSRKDLPPLIVGGTGQGSVTDDGPKILNAALGTNFRVVSGYGGTSEIRLAVESGELQGLCWSYDSVVATARNWLDTGFIKIPIYFASERDARVEERHPGAVRADDLATDPQAKALIRAATGPNGIAKSFVTPPGVPRARFQALRNAFWATMNDPAFLADAEQAKFEVNANPGEKTEQAVNELLSMPPEVVAKLKETLKQ